MPPNRRERCLLRRRLNELSTAGGICMSILANPSLPVYGRRQSPDGGKAVASIVVIPASERIIATLCKVL